MKNRRKTISNGLIYISFFAVILLWFGITRFHYIMGDDLIYIYDRFARNGFIKTFMNPDSLGAGKLRPIAYMVLYIPYLICGKDYSKYFLFNELALGCLTIAIFRICQKINIKKFYAYITAVMVVITPFSTYAVYQVFGICEIFSLLCCIIFIYFTILLYNTTDIHMIMKYNLEIAVVFFLLIFNAERFIYIIIPFSLVVLLKKDHKVIHKFFSVLAVCTPIILRQVIYYAMRIDSISTGRGEATDLMGTLVAFALKGLVNMMGFSIGDQWHGGFQIQEISQYILIINICVSMAFIFLICRGISKCIEKRKLSDWVIVFIFSISSLFCYALVGETHGEDRFLWIPYLLCLISIFKFITDNTPGKKVNIVIIIVFCFIAISDKYYMQVKDHVHYRYSEVMAQTCMENMKNLNGLENITDIVCIGATDYEWVFGDQLFFHYYISSDIDTHYYEAYSDIPEFLKSETTVIVYPDSEYSIPYGVTVEWIHDYSNSKI